MFNISSLLQKFSKNIAESEASTKEICEIIKKHTGLEISSDNIEIKNFVLFVSASPVLKNKIFIHKKEILEEIAKISSTKVMDVR